MEYLFLTAVKKSVRLAGRNASTCVNFSIQACRLPSDKRRRSGASSVLFPQCPPAKHKYVHRSFWPWRSHTEHCPSLPAWRMTREGMRLGRWSRKLTSGVADVFKRLYWMEPGLIASIKSQISIESLNDVSWKLVKKVVFFAPFNCKRKSIFVCDTIESSVYFFISPVDDILIRNGCGGFGQFLQDGQCVSSHHLPNKTESKSLDALKDISTTDTGDFEMQRVLGVIHSMIAIA